MKLTSNKIFSFMLAAAFALTLAGCGGGGGMADTTDPDMPTMPDMCPAGQTGTPPDCAPERTPQEMCEDDGGRFEDDGMCTSAEMLEMERMAKIAAATAAAATKKTAIGAEGMQTSDVGVDLGGTAGANPIDIEHKDGAVSISVSRGDGDDEVEFAKKADLTGADGSTGSMNELGPNDDGMVEIAIVYTDIEAPTPTAFLTANPITVDNGVSTDTENDADGTTYEALEITGAAEMLMAADLTSPAAGLLNYSGGTEAVEADPGNNIEAADAVPAFSTDATFRGGAGTLTCNAGVDATCQVTYAADGAKTFGAGWVFTPTEGSMIDVEDADYLHYGVWLTRTDGEDGSEYGEVQTFAGSNAEATGSVGSVTGSATYEGGAAGVYVREVYKTTDGSVDTATSGHFKAKANLTATFGQVPVSDTDSTGTIAPNMLNTLNGMITAFELSGEEPNDWSVNLSGEIDDGAGTASGSANGGGDAGTFSATFHGPATDADNDPAAPHTVVGEFNASTGNGIVAGAFGGARKK